MKTTAIAVLVASAASVGFIGWRVHAMRRQTVNHFAVLGDASTSYTGGCTSVIGSAEGVLRASTASHASTLTVLVSGDDTTANEPRELAEYSVPVSRKAIEDRHGSERRQLEILRDLAARCNAIRPASISPVFMAVKQAIAGLRARGCRDGYICELRVASDLEENVESGIKERLNNPRGTGRSLPKTLNNAGIDVVFCGVAATGGGAKDPSGRAVGRRNRRDSSREDRLQQIWSSVFTNPESVKFEPFCPRPSAPDLSERAGLLGRHDPRR